MYIKTYIHIQTNPISIRISLRLLNLGHFLFAYTLCKRKLI